MKPTPPPDELKPLPSRIVTSVQGATGDQSQVDSNRGTADENPGPPKPLVNEKGPEGDTSEKEAPVVQRLRHQLRVLLEEKTETASTVGRLEAQNATLLEEVSRANLSRDKEQRRANDLEMKVQKGGFGDESRKFRIFLSLCTGFASRGAFDQATLRTAPGSESALLKHIAGLSELANHEAKTKKF